MRLDGSDQKVLQIVAVRKIAAWLRIGRSRRAEALAAAMIGCVPLLGCGLELIGGGDVGWFVWSTAVTYGALIVFMLLSAVYSWARVIALGPSIDSILDGEERVNVSRPLGRALGWTPQVVVFALGVICSTCVGALLSGPLGTYAGNAGPAYSLTIGWTGGIGALTVYWLWGAPVLLYPLARIKHPNLDWIAPLQTPAIQEASDLMIDSSRFAAFGLLLFTIPIALTVALASRTWSVWVLSVSPVIFSLVTVLACSFLPQIALESLVRRGKAQTLKTFRQQLPDLTSLLRSPTPQALGSVDLYERLAHSSVSIIDWKRLLEYGLLLLSSIIPVGVAILSSR
jgi:hypothetical protein